MRLIVNSKKMQADTGDHKYQIMSGGIEVCAIQQKRYLRHILDDLGVKIGEKISKTSYSSTFELNEK